MADVSVKNLAVKSIVFSHGGHITQKYTCEGDDINPPLEISNIPEEAVSLVLIVEDPDAPKGLFYHWLVWNIDPTTTMINEKQNPGISGTNSFGKTGYGGPCPPTGEHRYFFKVFALNAKLDLLVGASADELQQAMKDHIISSGELMGLYKKRNG